MIRSVIVAEENVLSIKIPDSYIGKKVEVIAFTLEEEVEANGTSTTETSWKFSAVRLDTKGFKFNRDEANER